MFIISFMIGLLIVISSIFVLRHEMNRAYAKRSQILEQAQIYKQNDLFEMLENLQISVNDMNNAFYDIVSDLEGNMSLNQKEIEDLRDFVQTHITNQQVKNVQKTQVQEVLVNNLRQMAKIKDETRDVKGDMTKAKELDGVTNESELSHVILDDLDESVNMNSELGEQMHNNSTDQAALLSKITTMRSQGYSLTEIAKKLEMGMGEIKLLIHMNNKK